MISKKTLLNITIDENHKVNIDCPDYTLLSTALSIHLGFDYFQNNKKELFHSLFFVLMNVVSMDKSGLLEKRFIEVFKKDVPEFRKENERIVEEIKKRISKRVIMEKFNLEKYLANPSRKLVTIDGWPVRIICTDAKLDSKVIVGLAMRNDGTECLFTWNKEGKIVFRNIDIQKTQIEIL